MVGLLVEEDTDDALVLVHFVVLIGQHHLVLPCRHCVVKQSQVASGVPHGQHLSSDKLSTAELGLGIGRLEHPESLHGLLYDLDSIANFQFDLQHEPMSPGTAVAG